MLNKTVCERCVSAYAKRLGQYWNEWGYRDEWRWDIGRVSCHDSTGWDTQSHKDAYDSCPYQLEHLMGESV